MTTDGRHWTDWPLNVSGVTSIFDAAYFDKVGASWYLADVNGGLYSSTDGHSFVPTFPTAASSATAPPVATGVFNGAPALLVTAGTTGRPEAITQAGLVVPVAGVAGDTSVFVTEDDSSVVAVGHEVPTSAVAGPLSAAPCDAALMCAGGSGLAQSTTVEAIAPSSDARVLVTDQNGSAHSVFLRSTGGFARSSYLSRLVDSFSPHAPIASLQVGVVTSSNTWLLRVEYERHGRQPSGQPTDMLLAGDPRSDHWTVLSYAWPSTGRGLRPARGHLEPWTFDGCVNPDGGAIAEVGGTLLAEVCDGMNGVVFASRDKGKTWRLAHAG